MTRSLPALTLLFVLGLASTWNHAEQGGGARQLLDGALLDLKNAKGWNSDDMADKLSSIITSFPHTPESKTAQAMLVPYLMNKGDYDSALKLSDLVMAENPNSWQGAFASLNKVAVLRYQNKGPESLQAAITALPTLDAATKTHDPDFNQILQATEMDRSGLKDGVLALAASNLVEAGNQAAAAPLLAQIRDPKIKAQVFQGAASAPAASAGSGVGQ